MYFDVALRAASFCNDAHIAPSAFSCFHATLMLRYRIASGNISSSSTHALKYPLASSDMPSANMRLVLLFLRHSDALMTAARPHLLFSVAYFSSMILLHCVFDAIYLLHDTLWDFSLMYRFIMAHHRFAAK